MANLEYLLTLLPSLPGRLGDKVSVDEAYRLLRFEDNAKITYLADVLSIEDAIIDLGLNYYVLQNKSYQVELAKTIPESFKTVFYSFNEKSEADWMTAIYAAWFNVLIETSRKTGSSLLKEWAKWEYSLRINLMINRMKKAGQDIDQTELVPDFMRFGNDYDTSSIVEKYYTCSEPMKAERLLDQFRLDFIRSLAIGYSFSADELIAYMLELRIYARYARLDPEKGRKILQEVTAL